MDEDRTQLDLTYIPKELKKGFGLRGNSANLNRIRILAEERAQRNMDALKLFRPLPGQEEFFRSEAPERIVRGSNRAGKTLTVCVEIAIAATGYRPLWFRTNSGYPKEKCRIYIVGKDSRHLSQVLYRKLFKPGAFKVFYDHEKGKWFAVDPILDASREDEWKESPPLIPHRLISERSWENAAEEIPSLIRLKNGCEMSFYSSNSAPPQGVDVDLIVFDEEIRHHQWYPESAARLADRKGRFIWSATPQVGTEHLFSLHERAMSDDPDVHETFLHIKKNPYIPERAKQLLYKKWQAAGPQELQVRWEGEFPHYSMKVYPNFDIYDLHGVEPHDIPENWTIYAAIDPGRQVAAAIFIAIPPPRIGDHAEVFAEIYLRNAEAATFAQKMKEVLVGKIPQAFLIDHHMGRQTQMTTGKTVEMHYAEEFKKVGVRSRETGHFFHWGQDDVKGRTLALRKWINIGEHGTVKLKVHKGQCPNLVMEMGKQYYLKDLKTGVPTDKRPERNTPNHAVTCLEYLAGYEGVRWIKGTNREKPKSKVIEAKKMIERMFGPKRKDRKVVNLGPQGVPVNA